MKPKFKCLDAGKQTFAYLFRDSKVWKFAAAELGIMPVVFTGSSQLSSFSHSPWLSSVESRPTKLNRFV
jgi:hypothetical protein